MTLLEKAMSVAAKSDPGAEEVQLALAWITGVVSDVQAAEALGSGRNNVAGSLGRVLRRAIASGSIRIEAAR